MIELVAVIMMAFAALASIVFTYLAIVEKNLVQAVIFSAVQSSMYALIYYLLMAPDIALVYLPVGVGIYPAIVLLLIKKTDKVDGQP